MVLLPNALDSGSQGAVEEVELEEVDSEEITEEGGKQFSFLLAIDCLHDEMLINCTLYFTLA